jgi:hypothetical protein
MSRDHVRVVSILARVVEWDQVFTRAKMEDQMGSTSWTLAAEMRVWILSA